MILRRPKVAHDPDLVVYGERARKQDRIAKALDSRIEDLIAASPEARKALEQR